MKSDSSTSHTAATNDSETLPKVLHKSIAAESRIFRVQAQTIEFSNGTTVEYERLLGSKNGAVLIVPILDDGTMLLIREYGAGVERYELGFPKGKIDPGEDALVAAARECQEEVGYLPESLEFLDHLSLAASYMTHHTSIVLAENLSPSRAQGDEPEELEVVQWALKDWPSLLAHPEFTEGRAYAALMLVLQKKGMI